MTLRKQPLAKEINKLRNHIGDGKPYLHTTSEGFQEAYHILNEIEINGKHYAILHKHDDHVDDAYLFHIHQDQGIEIGNESEWEDVAEAVDEVMYFTDRL